MQSVFPEKSWMKAVTDYDWNFPKDHWARRSFQNEWWYLTGHLQSEENSPRSFGFQMTFFRIGILPDPPVINSEWSSQSIMMAHAAISDLDRKEHYFSEVLHRETPLLGSFSDYPDPLLAWSIGPYGTQEKWELSWNGMAFDFTAADDIQQVHFRLSTRPVKPLRFQGPNGFSRKSESEENASLYYSFTRLETEGELELKGQRYKVQGLSWMDKEFSSGALAEDQVGWDWFSLQLDDGSEYMLAQLRNQDQGPDYAWANHITSSNDIEYLEEGEFKLTPLDSWVSPESGSRYPIQWKIELPGRTFLVTAKFSDQENRSLLFPGLNYWEGAVEVENESGNAVGKGFLEMTGYGKSLRPPI
jgi:predicted secreted hydrolase